MNLKACGFALVSGLSLAACGGRSIDATVETQGQAIINGAPYEADQRPSALALIVDGGDQGVFEFCSSTLIAPDVALTAAHCVAAIQSDLAGYDVYATSTADVEAIFAVPADAVRVASVVIHPDYNGDTNPTPDVGLVFLEAVKEGTAPAAVLRTEESAHLRPGQVIEPVGWGLRTPGGQDAGRKFGAVTELNLVSDALLFFGTPLTGETTVNKCNGDSGGPSYLDVGGVVRVVGVASRSDCEHVTLDARADAFVAFYDSEMRARCSDGTRVSCAIPGLPTADELGAGVLPEPAPLDNPRQVPPAIDGALRTAGAHFGACFGLTADEGISYLYADPFALGAAACTPTDVDTGAAFLACEAAADCTDISNGAACGNEYGAMQSAEATCTDVAVVVPPDRVDEMSPPLLEGAQAYCDTLGGCGFTGGMSNDDCVAYISGQMGDLLDANCDRAEMIFGGVLDCISTQSCNAIGNENDPGGCYAAVSDAEWTDAYSRCDDLTGEGEGEGEGDGGEGEGEGDGGGEGEGDARADDGGENDSSAPGCASSTPGPVWLVGLALLVRRRARGSP